MQHIKNITLTLYFFCVLISQSLYSQNTFIQVKDSKITYIPDAKGNSVLDFSYCGYKSSEQDIPAVKNVIFVPKQEGDASDIIQRAISYVSQLSPDLNGFRGAVLLDKGVYNLNKSLWIQTSGVVLRGSDKHETVLLKHGFDRSALLHIEGVNNLIVKDTFKIESKYIPVNQRTFELSSVTNLKVGDRVKIIRPSTKEWISSIACDVFGGGIGALGWKPGDMDVSWDRTITEINRNQVTINAPLTSAIDSKFGGAKLFKYQWDGRISIAGVENLTMISDYNKQYSKDEDHCWTAVSVENAENCWVRMVNFLHFAGNAVILQPTSSQITVQDCIAKEPISEIGGFRRITFYTLGQLNLFQRCYSENGINDFAAGYCAPGPNAFVQCEAKNALGFSGAIDAWACGLLFDIVNIDGHNLTFKNLGQSKNGAGWGTANSLFWQCSAAEIECYSPAIDAKNRAYGCWAQFSGDGEWAESNNHVQPRSLYYAQLAARLNHDVSSRARILPISTDASSSPSVEMAQAMMKAAYTPLLTIEDWIEKAVFNAPVERTALFTSTELKRKPMLVKAYIPNIAIENGRLVSDNALITGYKMDVQWWNGKLKPNFRASLMTKPHISRFVPGREGTGLTDRLDSVVGLLKSRNFNVLEHNYGLWYDRRRDDHERIRRRDGDVWAPFYEQAFARSGHGLAWDGLSKYDLNRPNEWYWMRLKDFADKAQRKGILLFHNNFFQHNIIEAGAHWVDSPWRTANNINDLGFPEPVNFAGDKRIFRSEMFYDISNSKRREYYRNYIRQCLNSFSENQNVVQLISSEYTGPLHFMQFWLDIIDEWQQETGKNALVALSATKDVQDAILSDSKRAAVVDIIDIRYWHYKNDGTLYSPLGGLNLAPRQHERLQKVGKVTFAEAYKAVSEYRTKFPDKAVSYFTQNYNEMAWAVFMAGGSCPAIRVDDQEFLKAASKMEIVPSKSSKYWQLGKIGTGIIIFSQEMFKIPVQLEAGKYSLKFIDCKTGKTQVVKKNIVGGQLYNLKTFSSVSGAFWFQKL
jgi:hypothetical protein